MNRRTVRNLLAIFVLVATVIATILFLQRNPKVLERLSATPISVIILLLSLYIIFMVSLWAIFRGSLLLSNAVLPRGETMLVTAYSSIINFFGPLQSGPAFRAIYLKKRHNVSLKRYALASLVYYFFYAFFSGLCLLSGLIGWWTLTVGLIAVSVIYGLSRLPNRKITQFKNLNKKGFLITGAATAVQVSILVTIFYIELKSVDSKVTLQQAISYTGAANFALFVSITPGAIGFRESFVLATQQIHNLPNVTVVAASLLDRAVYVMMLLLLAVGIFSTQAKKTLGQFKAK